MSVFSHPLYGYPIFGGASSRLFVFSRRCRFRTRAGKAAWTPEPSIRGRCLGQP